MRVYNRVHPDAGQAVPLLLAVVALIAVVMAATAHLGARVVVEEHAQVAADAAALAGLDGGRPAAERLARANDGVLVAFAGSDLDVQVTVRVGDATATARATRAP
ncbi:MAG: hypothetical protein Q8M22_18850 [Actinomycetota bacterium]|nr:hypothetical protein [Actinomycetota bacterium]